jgi:hypothetical protein
MTIATRLASCLLVLIAMPLVRAADVKTDWDRSVDFGRFETFNWSDPERIGVDDPAERQRLIDAVGRRLEAKGLEPKLTHSDLWVVLHVSGGEQAMMSTTGFGPAWDGWYAWGGVVTSIETIPRETLVIDLIQRPDDKLVWRSVAGGAVPHKGASVDLDAILDRMFEDFPPPRPSAQSED